MRPQALAPVRIGLKTAGLALLGAVLLPGPLSAQSTAPKLPEKAAPVSSEPGTTSATFGDWVMRCQRLGETDKPVRVCEAAQVIQVQGQKGPIAQIAIGRSAPGEPLRVTVAVVPEISFPSSVQVTDDKGGAPLDLAWRRCLPGGCFADAAARDDLLKRWRGETEPGRITFKDAAGRDATLPLSFRGLSPALEALAKERV